MRSPSGQRVAPLAGGVGEAAQRRDDAERDQREAADEGTVGVALQGGEQARDHEAGPSTGMQRAGGHGGRRRTGATRPRRRCAPAASRWRCRHPASPSRLSGVSMTRGRTALARMPCSRSSRATTSTRACTAAFERIGPTPPANGRQHDAAADVDDRAAAGRAHRRQHGAGGGVRRPEVEVDDAPQRRRSDVSATRARAVAAGAAREPGRRAELGSRPRRRRPPRRPRQQVDGARRTPAGAPAGIAHRRCDLQPSAAGARRPRRRASPVAPVTTTTLMLRARSWRWPPRGRARRRARAVDRA